MSPIILHRSAAEGQNEKFHGKEKNNKLCIRKIFGLINCNNFAFSQAFLLNFFVYLTLAFPKPENFNESYSEDFTQKTAAKCWTRNIRRIASDLASLDIKHSNVLIPISRRHIRNSARFIKNRMKFIAPRAVLQSHDLFMCYHFSSGTSHRATPNHSFANITSFAT